MGIASDGMVKKRRKLNDTTQNQDNDNIPVVRAHTTMLDFIPGDGNDIKHQRTAIRLKLQGEGQVKSESFLRLAQGP